MFQKRQVERIITAIGKFAVLSHVECEALEDRGILIRRGSGTYRLSSGRKTAAVAVEHCRLGFGHVLGYVLSPTEIAQQAIQWIDSVEQWIDSVERSLREEALSPTFGQGFKWPGKALRRAAG